MSLRSVALKCGGLTLIVETLHACICGRSLEKRVLQGSDLFVPSVLHTQNYKYYNFAVLICDLHITIESNFCYSTMATLSPCCAFGTPGSSMLFHSLIHSLNVTETNTIPDRKSPPSGHDDESWFHGNICLLANVVSPWWPSSTPRWLWALHAQLHTGRFICCRGLESFPSRLF
jgi:hypothetical protein